MILEKYLQELNDLAKPAVASKLINLTGLTPDEVKLFKTKWPTIEVRRRRRIVHLLLELAEGNCELDFDEVFRACLSDSDSEVRGSAIEGLWDCEDRSLITCFIGLLKEDSEVAVRATAAIALGKFSMLAEFEKLCPNSAAKVKSALLTAINDETEHLEVRRRAIEAISPLSHPQVKEIIREAYQSDSPKLRVSAIHAMGQNCDPMWLPMLLKELSSPEPEMRFEAAAACGKLEDQSAVPHLIKLTYDLDAQVQSCAIEALGHIGGEEARQRLHQCLSSPDERIQEAAEVALDELGFEEAPLPFNIK